MALKIVKLIPLILLVLAIGLSPSFPSGELVNGKVIELRIEDFLVALLGLIWLALFLGSKKDNIEKPILLLPILGWISVGIISVLINFFLTRLSLDKGFFYVLKEIQYFFFYFYFFYHVKNILMAKIVFVFWFLIAGINMAYLFYQVRVGKIFGTIYQFINEIDIKNHDYGASAFAEEGSLPRGMIFLLLFIFFSNYLLYYFFKKRKLIFTKILLSAITLSCAAGVFYSGSRTAFLGLIFSLFWIVALFIFKRRNFKLLLAILLLLIIGPIVLFSLPKSFIGPQRIINTLSSGEFLFSEIIRSRIDSGIMPTLQEALARKNLFFAFFGFGKGSIGEGHNQYLLNFITVGIVGSFAFLILILAVIKKSLGWFLRSRDFFSTALASGMFIATLAMLFCSLASDPFMVVKSAEIYWSFIGLGMAVLKLEKKEEKLNNRNI